jgi:hypothetical protein
MSFAGSLLEQSRVYRTWQTSRVRRKSTPVLVRYPSRWAKLVLSEEPFVVRLPPGWHRSGLAHSPKKWQRLFDVVFEPVVPRRRQFAGMCVTIRTTMYVKGSPA